jgi:hypothetical protein
MSSIKVKSPLLSSVDFDSLKMHANEKSALGSIPQSKRNFGKYQISAKSFFANIKVIFSAASENFYLTFICMCSHQLLKSLTFN